MKSLITNERMIKRFVSIVDRKKLSTSDVVRETNLHYQTIYNFKKGWNISSRTRKALDAFIEKYGK